MSSKSSISNVYYFYIREIIKINVLNGFGKSLDGWGTAERGTLANRQGQESRGEKVRSEPRP